MPTFFDSTADAAEASEALRGLAHASRTFDQPAQMYGVIGDLSSGMRSLHQVLEQLADVHERKAAHAFNDDGDHTAGVRDALATTEELRHSARLVDQAYDRLAEGFIAAGRIAWHPEPAVEEALPSRWINVVELNPLMHYLDIVRAPLLGAHQELRHWAVVLVLTVVGWAVAALVLRQYRARVAYWV